MSKVIGQYYDVQLEKLIPYYRFRPIKKRNFSPMLTHSILWKDFERDYVQVKVKSFDQYVWINVSKKHLEVK